MDHQRWGGGGRVVGFLGAEEEFRLVSLLGETGDMADSKSAMTEAARVVAGIRAVRPP